MNNENSKIKAVCYHGTSSEPFTVLDKTKIQKDPEDGDAGYFGWGFYLTTDKNYAEEYGDTVLAFKVNIENPFDFTNVNGQELVDFIFKDCKNLKLRVKETLRILYQIGREVLEFDANNSKELLEECIKLYNNYRDKEVDSEYIKDVKDVLIKLSPEVNNWLNGLFFYFGRELFHYFTMSGYDGVIVQGGKEVVVYESEQLEPIVQEDLDLDVFDTPDWQSGAEEYTKKIVDSLKANPDVNNLKLYTNKFYPERKCSVWYEEGLLQFNYKDLLEIYFYCGGEIEIYRESDDPDPILDVSDLEAEGIFTDNQYYAFMNDNDIWGNGLADNNTKYFGFVVTPLKNNPRQDTYYSYDLGYDDFYELDEIFESNGGDPLGWVFSSLIPEFKEDYPEYFEESKPDDKEEKIQEETRPTKKHITKGQVLNDVIRTFGNISADKLTDAIYLLPNGNILDTKGPYEKSQHENVAKYISSKYNVKDMDENNGSKLMLELGAMRITPWIPAMFIPEYPLTDKQEDALQDILIGLIPKVSADNPLMISTADGSQQIEFTSLDNPDEVVNSILGYQVFGILKA